PSRWAPPADVSARRLDGNCRGPGTMSSQSWIDSSAASSVNLAYPPALGGDSAGRRLNVVCFGGGTGLSTLLAQLKWYVAQPAGSAKGTETALIERLTAVVAV